MKDEEIRDKSVSDKSKEIELAIDKEFEKLFGLAYTHDEDAEKAGAETRPETAEEDVKVYDSSDVLFEDQEDIDNDEYNISNISFETQEEDTEKTRKKKNKKPMSAKKKKVLKILLSVFLVGVITVCVTVGGILIYLFNFMDNSIPEDLDTLKLDLTSLVYIKDDNGEWVEYQRIHGVENRIWVSLDKIPDQLENAFIAIEDERFWTHSGVDWKRSFAALGNEIFGYYDSRQGGSTITQQLVKNLTGDKDQSATRKIREMLRAMELEKVYSKDTILECYLNTIPLGGSCYGVEVAAEYYFGKKIDELSLAENAILASITQSPNKLRPDRAFEKCWERAKNVLAKMLELEYISQEEYQAALESEIVIVADGEAVKEAEINSYFVDTMITQVATDMAEKYGYEVSDAIQMIYTNGYKIYSTLDPEIQAAVEKQTTNDKWFDDVTAKDGVTKPQVAITIMDYEGHIVASVGGRGEKDGNRLLDRTYSIYRQPGSGIKPLGVYALGIENNIIDYSTVIEDSPVTQIDGKDWPRNFYEGYMGNRTVEQAIGISINTIPCKILQTIGVDTSFNFVTNILKLNALNPGYDKDQTISALAMGGTNGGVTTTQLAAAYAIFGNLGKYYEPKTYYKVTDSQGNLLLEVNQNNYTQAISEDSAEVMCELLQYVVTGYYTSGEMYENICANGTPMFAKTGTSTDYFDNWVNVGSPYYVGSIWYGFDQPESCNGTFNHKYMLAEIFRDIHKNLPFKDFPQSGEVVQARFCEHSGLLAGENCIYIKDGWFKKDRVPEVCTRDVHLREGEVPEETPNENEQETSSETE